MRRLVLFALGVAIGAQASQIARLRVQVVDLQRRVHRIEDSPVGRQVEAHHTRAVSFREGLDDGRVRWPVSREELRHRASHSGTGDGDGALS